MQHLIIEKQQALKHARYLEHYSYSHTFLVFKRLILTWRPKDMMMQLNSRRRVDLEFTETASIVNDAFTNLPRPEMAAAMLDEKLPATILPLGQGWHCDQVATLLINIKRICSSFKHRRSQSRAGFVALKLHLDSDVKRKVVKQCLFCIITFLNSLFS